MAAATKVSTSVVIVTKVGETSDGKNILKKTTINNVATSAVDQDIYDVVSAIGKVLNFPVQEIEKIDENVLTNA